MNTPVLPGGFPENEIHQDTGLAELSEETDIEVDQENFPLIVDLQEYARRKVYDEFWGDLCWVEPEENQ